MPKNLHDPYGTDVDMHRYSGETDVLVQVYLFPKESCTLNSNLEGLEYATCQTPDIEFAVQLH